MHHTLLRGLAYPPNELDLELFWRTSENAFSTHFGEYLCRCRGGEEGVLLLGLPSSYRINGSNAFTCLLYSGYSVGKCRSNSASSCFNLTHRPIIIMRKPSTAPSVPTNSTVARNRSKTPV